MNNNNIQDNLNKNTEQLLQLQAMFSEIKECFADGSFALQCAAAITEKYLRRLSFIRDLVYPWRNYDWDYTEYVKKNYNTKLLKVSGDGTATAIINDVNAILKLIEGLLFDANPDNNSSASNPASRNNDLVDCYNQAGGVSCQILNAAKMSYLNQNAPYEDDFFKKHLDGQYSSSYFVKVGMCPTNISDKKTCEAKNFKWIPNPLYELPKVFRGPDTKAGSCYRGKYTFIDNKPGLEIGQIQDTNGLIPSLAKDMLEISPDKIMAAAMGIGIPGMDIQKCNESFTNKKSNYKSFSCRYNNSCKNYKLIICFIVTIVIIIMIKLIISTVV